MRVIDKLVEQWHNDKATKTQIHEYLGLTLAEYDEFVNTDRVPDRLPRLSAEFVMPKPDPRLGAMAPPGHPMQPGWIVPAKREV